MDPLWIEHARGQWGSAGVWIAGIAVVAGLILWLAGSRVSRSVVTLALVAAGAMVGKKLPILMGWSIDPMGLAIAGALSLGVLGYVCHRYWSALALGVMLAIWAGWATWVFFGADPTGYPALSGDMTAMQIAQAVWADWPQAMRTWLPIASGVGLMGGITLGLVWSRIGISLLFSLVGVTILLALGGVAAALYWPAGLDRIPVRHGMQAAMVGGLVTLGFSVQCWLSHPMAAPSTGKKAAGDDDDWD